MHLLDRSIGNLISWPVVQEVHPGSTGKWRKMPTDQSFILSLFWEAFCRTEFQQKWMSTDTWAALINKYYVFDSNLVFTGKELLASINNQKQRHLQSQIDLKSNIPFDHVGIFHEKHRFKGKSSYSCFYLLQLKEVLH
jgi:hypothetical protein